MKLGLFIAILLFLLSCGKDPFKNPNPQTTTLNFSSSGGCLCTTDYMPVCGEDKKDYENLCLSQCFGNKKSTSGHCKCEITQTVCGSDHSDFNECDAIAKNITILKYESCGNSNL
jgi:hypothetical protein